MYPLLLMVYITTPNEGKAQELAQYLLQKKLIACANIVSIKSMYWWEGNIAQDDEFVVIAKTIPAVYDVLVREVESIHPYSVPCIVRIEIQANQKYAEWVLSMIKE